MAAIPLPSLQFDHLVLGDIVARATPPSGAYVAHAGRFYAHTAKSGYPLSVVADIAAASAGCVVGFVQESGLVAVISGTDRKIYCKFDAAAASPAAKDTEANSSPSGEYAAANSVYTSLLRLTLQSRVKEVVVIGDVAHIGAFPCRQVFIKDLSLPPVIRRSRTWQVLGIVPLMCLIALIFGMVLRASFSSRAEQQKTLLSTAQEKMADALSEVRDGRAKIQKAKEATELASPDLPVLVGEGGGVPAVQVSFVDQYMQSTLGNQEKSQGKEFRISVPAAAMPQTAASAMNLGGSLLAQAAAMAGAPALGAMPPAPPAPGIINSPVKVQNGRVQF